MELLTNSLPWIQVSLSVILVIVILFQQSSAGAGGAFGGGSEDTINHTRRGAEKILFQLTIIIAILFSFSVFLPLII